VSTESKGPARPRRGLTGARAEEAAVITSAVRAMTFDDLPQVASVTETAFAALHRREDRAAPAAAAIPALLIRTRLTADPAGCFVAVSQQDPGLITGALLSVARDHTGCYYLDSWL